MPLSEPTTDHFEIQHWAEIRGAVPVEVLPQTLDSEPAILRLMLKEQARQQSDVRIISWDEFFVKFDELGLTLVYDSGPTGYNEILQIESRSPYRHPEYRAESLKH